MSVLKTAVLRQIAYARSIRSVIRAIMRRMLDGEWINRIFASSDDEFSARLDEALKSLDLVNATKRDFCGAVVDVLCNDVSDLCLALKDVCEGSGYSDYYESHISHERFVRLVLSVDTVKLGRMKKILEDARRSPIDVLRGIGAVLNDEPIEERAALGTRERRRANAELKAIAADVKKTMQTGFKEVNDNIKSATDAVVEKVDAVDAKVSKLRVSSKPRGRYTQKAKTICWNYWITAANHEEVWRSVNTRITYKAVFDHYHARLAQVGVNDCNAFRSIIRAEDRRRNRELSARQDAARRNSTAKSGNKTQPKNGIMSDMRNRAKSTLALTLAIAGALALPLRSDASLDALRGSDSWQSCVAALYAPRSALPDPARAEVCGRVVKVADGDTLTILDAANAQHKIRLNAIDAPEKAQAFGQKSKQHLSSLVFGKDVRVTYTKRDKYGRILGMVYADGRDVNLEMLRAGLAWHYKRFDSTPAYAAAESEARQNKRGLWQDKNPIPPEEFRHRDKSTAPPAASSAAPVNDALPDTGFWLSTNSNKRHNRKCDNYRKTRGYPCSASDGTPCGKCEG